MRCPRTLQCEVSSRAKETMQFCFCHCDAKKYPQRLLTFCMLTPKVSFAAPFLHEGGCRKPITNYLHIITNYLHIITNYLHIIINYLHKISHCFCLLIQLTVYLRQKQIISNDLNLVNNYGNTTVNNYVPFVLLLTACLRQKYMITIMSTYLIIMLKRRSALPFFFVAMAVADFGILLLLPLKSFQICDIRLILQLSW